MPSHPSLQSGVRVLSLLSPLSASSFLHGTREEQRGHAWLSTGGETSPEALNHGACSKSSEDSRFPGKQTPMNGLAVGEDFLIILPSTYGTGTGNCHAARFSRELLCSEGRIASLSLSTSAHKHANMQPPGHSTGG